MARSEDDAELVETVAGDYVRGAAKSIGLVPICAWGLALVSVYERRERAARGNAQRDGNPKREADDGAEHSGGRRYREADQCDGESKNRTNGHRDRERSEVSLLCR
jgi:hypothetical protein